MGTLGETLLSYLYVVGHLHHDDRERDGEPGDPAEESHGTHHRHRPGVHPVPVRLFVSRLRNSNFPCDLFRRVFLGNVYRQAVRHCLPDDSPVEPPYEQHGDDQAAGDVRPRRPAGQPGVGQQCQEQGKVAQLLRIFNTEFNFKPKKYANMYLVCASGKQVVNDVLPGAEPQVCGL